MKLIDRYLLRSFLVPLAYCLLAFCLLYIVFDLFNNLSDFMEAKTPLVGIVTFYAFLLPSVLIYIVPVSLMLAVLYALSRLTRSNELTAMRACGLSIFRLVTPLIASGLCAAMLMGLINETIGPLAAYYADQYLRFQQKHGDVSVYVATDLPYKNEMAHRIWVLGKFDSRSRAMRNVSVIQQRADGSDAYKIMAERGRWLDGQLAFEGEVSRQDYDEEGNPLGGPRFQVNMPATGFTETAEDFINEIKDPAFLSTLELITFLRTHPHLSPEKRARIQVDMFSRLAMPWMCLVVTMLGIPFGVHTGRRGALPGISLALLLFFAFYVLVNICLWMGKKQMIEPWLAGWLPNLMYFIMGGILIKRME